MTDEHARWLAKDTLIFLSGLPNRFLDCPSGSERWTAENAITLGNAIRGIAFDLEPGPHVEDDLIGPARTLYGLAMQLRAVGLRLWDAQPGERSQVQRLSERLERLELTVLKGGVE